MSKRLSYKIGTRSFDVENSLAMNQTDFAKMFKDKVQDPEGVYKTLKAIKEEADKKK